MNRVGQVWRKCESVVVVVASDPRHYFDAGSWVKSHQIVYLYSEYPEFVGTSSVWTEREDTSFEDLIERSLDNWSFERLT